MQWSRMENGLNDHPEVAADDDETTVLDIKEVLNEMETVISKVREVIDLDRTICKKLLGKFKWYFIDEYYFH